MPVDTRACPHCGVGVAYAIERDESGTKWRCFSCQWQGAQAASEEMEAGAVMIPDSVAGPRTAGNPGPGNLTYDGDSPGRAVESRHEAAGPAVTAEDAGSKSSKSKGGN